MILAVLIPTLASRADLRARLMNVLGPQLNSECEVEFFEDEGQRTTGAKRQTMIESSDAEYVAFVDDDDLVSADYVSRILGALRSKPEVVGFRLRHFHDGVQTGRTIHSMRCQKWAEHRGADGMMEFFRTPNHLNPIKREIAVSVGYTDRTFGEDSDYSHRLYAQRPDLRETFIDWELYDYLYRSCK